MFTLHSPAETRLMHYPIFHLEASLAESTWSQNSHCLMTMIVKIPCQLKKLLLDKLVLVVYSAGIHSKQGKKKKVVNEIMKKDLLLFIGFFFSCWFLVLVRAWPALPLFSELMHSGLCYDDFHDWFGDLCCSYCLDVHALHPLQVLSLKFSRWL